jgi:hypothetical protein
MPVHSVGDQRWAHAGYNSAGDRVYRRTEGNTMSNVWQQFQTPAGESVGASEYEGLTKDELSAELERRGLPKTGNKDELIARLQEDDNG